MAILTPFFPVIPKMFIRHLAVLIATALCGGAVLAQQTNNDYYQARSDPHLAELLAAVEKYHEQPGIDKLRTRFYPAAWGDFNFILSYFPNHPRALMLMGQLCEHWQDPRCNMALYFDRALQKSPDNEGVYLTRGVYLQKRGKIDEAIESYKKALEINPNSANTHYNLGLAYAAQKKFELANEHAQEAYSRGITLPGLQQKLVTAKAWKPLPPKPVPEPAEAPPAAPTAAEAPQPAEPAKTDGDKEAEPAQGQQGEAH